MMPQKKNPDVLELTRGRTGQIIGHFVDLLVMLKGLPMTYNRDLQEDKRGLLASLAVILSIIEILPEFLSRVEVDEKRAVLGMENGMILATDVAEYLVKEGVPFRDAHWKAGQLVRYCLDNGRSLLDLTLSEWKAIIPEAKEDLLSILSLKESVARRQTYGGTGFICVERQIEEGDGWLAYQKKRDNACSSS
jgi:argininosuccinate lyase